MIEKEIECNGDGEGVVKRGSERMGVEREI